MKDLFRKLDLLGADTREGLDRVMNNEMLYIRCLKIFSHQASEASMQEALDRKDYDDLVSQTHTFKGTTGNLSLKPLYERYTKIVADIRAGDYDGLQSQLDEILQLQGNFCQLIEEA